jgi:transcriptional regulator with XRE-family HTH domain
MRLDEYVSKVMKEKGFTAYQVQKNSEGAIKDSYVARLAEGKSKYPSVPKLKDLAKGLQVDFWELVAVAANERVKEGLTEEWTPESLADAMAEVARDEDLREALKILLRASPEKRTQIVKYLRRK